MFNSEKTWYTSVQNFPREYFKVYAVIEEDTNKPAQYPNIELLMLKNKKWYVVSNQEHLLQQSYTVIFWRYQQ